MTLFNLFRHIVRPDPVWTSTTMPLISVPPGEIHITRNWTDDPQTDTTVIIIGGQISSRQLVDIKAILQGRATAHRKPGRWGGRE